MVTQQLLVSLEPDIPQDLATWTVSGACYCCHGHCLWTILFILTRHLPILGPHHCSLSPFSLLSLQLTLYVHWALISCLDISNCLLGEEVLFQLGIWAGQTCWYVSMDEHLVSSSLPGGMCVYVLSCSGPCLPFKRWWCGFFLDLPVALLFAFWSASSPAVTPETRCWMFSLCTIQSESQC